MVWPLLGTKCVRGLEQSHSCLQAGALCRCSAQFHWPSGPWGGGWAQLWQTILPLQPVPPGPL